MAGVVNVQVYLSHTLGHQIGARWDVPHGITSGITLPPVMEFLAPRSPDAVERVDAVVGAPTACVHSLLRSAFRAGCATSVAGRLPNTLTWRVPRSRLAGRVVSVVTCRSAISNDSSRRCGEPAMTDVLRIAQDKVTREVNTYRLTIDDVTNDLTGRDAVALLLDWASPALRDELQQRVETGPSLSRSHDRRRRRGARPLLSD